MIDDGAGGAPTGGQMTGYVVGFILLFILSGIGNGSTYKMTPSIFEAKAQGHGEWSRDDKAAWSRSMSGALIGFAGAIGALGGVFINVVLRASYVGEAKSATNAFWVFLAFYVVCAVVTWAVFLRMRHAEAGRANSSGRLPRPQVDRSDDGHPDGVLVLRCRLRHRGYDRRGRTRHRQSVGRQTASGQLRPAVHQGRDTRRDDGRRQRKAEIGPAPAVPR